jgi:1-acyl-sn-glycerol-3-phosphate acyltransferase
MKEQLVDRKHWLSYAILSTVGKVIIGRHFKRVEVQGAHHLPKDRGYILVANHSTRWDGLLLYYLINRPANFVVSPNELSGLQGILLKAMGSFPASARYDLQSHVCRQFDKGEPIAIFPEGDVYRDGTTHKFKSGAARFAINMAATGRQVDVVPAAISYSSDGSEARILVSHPVNAADYLPLEPDASTQAVRNLTERLHREVCHARYQLGCRADLHVLFGNHARPREAWALPPHTAA